jgi:Glucose / Sorbosone dehydrogenase
MAGPLRALGLGALLAVALGATARAAPTLVPVGTFDNPLYVASPPQDTSRLFVVQRGGVIRVVRGGTVLPTPFLDLSGGVATDGERGLLSIAFPPDYASSGLFYVYLAAQSPLGQLQIRQYHRSASNPDVADPAGRIVWVADHGEASNHDGGTIAFGPDGKLWLGTGDGGGADDEFHHAQDLGSPLGKLIRLDPRGTTAPPDNPFGSYVWARGLRNPFRWSFDRVTGDLVVGDVGQDAREEVDWLPRASGLGRGADLGWACREGTIAGPTPADCIGAKFTDPVFDYSQPSPRAITGGVVVRDPGLPTLVGRYVYADSFAGNIRSFVLASPRVRDDRSAGLPHVDQLVAFGEDACGHVYVVSLTAGTVDRIQDGAPGACVLRFASLPPLPRGAPRDTRPCRLSLRVRGARTFARRHRLALALTSDEACRIVAGGRVRGVAGLQAVRRSLAAQHRATVSLRLGRHGVRRLRAALRRHRALVVALQVQTVDRAGNRGLVKRRVSVRRR